MSTLHVALNDGFRDEAVTLRVNGVPVYSKTGLRTDLRISRADAVDLPLDDGPSRVSVEVRGRSFEIDLDPDETPHLSVDLSDDGQPVLRPSSDERPML